MAGASLEHVMAICRKVGRPLTMAFTPLPPPLTSSAASNGCVVEENGVEEPERQQPMPEQAVIKGPRAQDTDAPVNAVGANEVGGLRQKRAERANYGCVSI